MLRIPGPCGRAIPTGTDNSLDAGHGRAVSDRPRPWEFPHPRTAVGVDGREPYCRWVVVMAGHDVVLELRKALPGQWYRVLPARDREELEQRMSIVVPVMLLIEIDSLDSQRLEWLHELHRVHPPIPWIAVIDTANGDLTPLLIEKGARKTLIKPIDCRMIRRAVETEIPDSRLGWQERPDDRDTFGHP